MISDVGQNGMPKTGIKREGIGYGHPPKETRFKPGNKAGAKGRPVGTSLTAIIKRVLSEPDKKYGTKADALIAMAEKKAKAGDFRFFKELIDRNDGKVPDRIADANGDKLVIEVVRTHDADSSN